MGKHGRRGESGMGSMDIDWTLRREALSCAIHEYRNSVGPCPVPAVHCTVQSDRRNEDGLNPATHSITVNPAPTTVPQ